MHPNLVSPRSETLHTALMVPLRVRTSGAAVLDVEVVLRCCLTLGRTFSDLLVDQTWKMRLWLGQALN